MAKPKVVKLSDVVHESVKFSDTTKVHVLKKLFNGPAESLPTLTSIGYAPIKGTNKYISYIITSKGNEIIKIEASEPDLLAIIEDEAKCNFVTSFMSRDGI